MRLWRTTSAAAKDPSLRLPGEWGKELEGEVRPADHRDEVARLMSGHTLLILVLAFTILLGFTAIDSIRKPSGSTRYES